MSIRSTSLSPSHFLGFVMDVLVLLDLKNDLVSHQPPPYCVRVNDELSEICPIIRPAEKSKNTRKIKKINSIGRVGLEG